MSELLTLLMAVCFLIAGWFLFKHPKAVQQWVVQLQQENRLVAEMNPLRNWIEKQSFLVVAQLLGALCLVNTALLLAMLFLQAGQNSGAGF